MKKVPVQEAIGLVLGHDLTRVVPGQSKGVAFRRGHVIRPEDVPVLLDMGKEHVYILEVPPGHLHEEEAAVRVARALAGDGVRLTDPEEGKVNLRAARDGLLRVDVERLRRVNSVGEIQVATATDRRPVRAGDTVAGCRVTPLVIEESQVLAAEAIGREGPVLQVLPYRPLRAGIVVTGSEVYKGRIADAFGPVVQTKLEALGATVVYKALSDDKADMIASHIRAAAGEGAELICVTGGMSVDPDDATPGAIRQAGARVVTYGAPVLPGSMFLLAYLGTIPVMGLPGAVMHESRTIFDYVLPRLMAGETLTKADFVEMGHGGLLSRRW